MKLLKCVLKRNPVTAVRHIDYMFQKLFYGVVIRSPHPIGQILRYDTKRDFREEDVFIFILFLMLKMCLSLTRIQMEKITKFVDKHISCSLLNEHEDKDLHELVTSLQTHKYSQTCKKRIHSADSFSHGL